MLLLQSMSLFDVKSWRGTKRKQSFEMFCVITLSDNKNLKNFDLTYLHKLFMGKVLSGHIGETDEKGQSCSAHSREGRNGKIATWTYSSA